MADRSDTTARNLDAAGKKPRRWPLRARLLLLLTSTLGTLLLAEAGLRWVTPYRFFYKFPRFEVSSVEPSETERLAADPLLGPGIQPVPGYGYRLKRNMCARFSSSEFDTEICTNDLGMRNGPVGAKKDLRILGLGDSFAMGWGVEAHESFYSFLPERSRRDGLKVETLNAAVFGHNVWNCLAVLQTLGTDLRPDLVVVEIWSRNLLPGPVLRAPALSAGRGTRDRIKELALRCHLAMLATETLRGLPTTRALLFRHNVLGREQVDAIFSPNLEQEQETELGYLADALGRIKAWCTEHGAVPIVLLIPMREQVHARAWQWAQHYYLFESAAVDFDAPNAALKKIADRLGLRLVDATASLRARGRAEPDRAYGGDYFTGYDVHLTAQGHRLVADLLYPAVHSGLAAARAARKGP